MIKYYFNIHGVQKGPYTLEEIKNGVDVNIKLNTKVWHEGLSDWTTIKDLDEFSFLPPPIKHFFLIELIMSIKWKSIQRKLGNIVLIWIIFSASILGIYILDLDKQASRADGKLLAVFFVLALTSTLRVIFKVKTEDVPKKVKTEDDPEDDPEDDRESIPFLYIVIFSIFFFAMLLMVLISVISTD